MSTFLDTGRGEVPQFALSPSVSDEGVEREQRWVELCDEIFRFGMRPEVTAVAQDALNEG